jgi:uncharacterized protein YeaO (DUF488 family)
MGHIYIKRVYEAPEKEDGYRILVDRLWPRGIKKEDLPINEWNKLITPSPDLRKWFNHQEDHFSKFAEDYRKELDLQTDELKRIKQLSLTQNVTLLFAAKSKIINHAVILKDKIDEQAI